MSGAKEMCFSLWTAGYWADFIDPTTGTAVSPSLRVAVFFFFSHTKDAQCLHKSTRPYVPRQFFASPLSQTTLRTEEELRHLGFHIEASGSCTVIRHILRGTPLFVGTVFTNAPTHSAAIARLQGLSNILEDED